MGYKKQTFVDGQTILTANMLNHIEEGIAMAEQLAEEAKNAISLLPNISARIGEVTLPANGWIGTGNLFSQVVTISGVTAHTQVDLTPSVEQLVIFYEKDLTFVTENENGVVTVYVIGQKPQNDYTIQVTLTEVTV